MKTRYIPKNSEEIKRDGIDAVAYTYVSERGYLCAITYSGKKAKEDARFRFSNNAEREQFIEKHFKTVAVKAQAMIEAKEARKVAAARIKPGDIFCCSWGYGQTNVDFYRAEKISGVTMKVRQVSSKITSSGRGADSVEPDESIEAGDLMTKRVSECGGFRVNSFSWARPYDGNPKYQTSLGYGH